METLDYIAPEQLADTHSVDIRADLYSLGWTLFRLLTGEPPFAGPSLNTAAKKMFARSFTLAPKLIDRRTADSSSRSPAWRASCRRGASWCARHQDRALPHGRLLRSGRCDSTSGSTTVHVATITRVLGKDF